MDMPETDGATSEPERLYGGDPRYVLDTKEKWVICNTKLYVLTHKR